MILENESRLRYGIDMQTKRYMKEDKRTVLKRPRIESARKPPRIGNMQETPIHVLICLAAVAVDWPSSFVRNVIRLLARP